MGTQVPDPGTPELRSASRIAKRKMAAATAEAQDSEDTPEILQTTYKAEEEIGRDDWIRTSDPLTPSQVRYQAALHPDVGGAECAAGTAVLTETTLGAVVRMT
jgi:hypothetical protein